jgi:sulfur carrier protein
MRITINGQSRTVAETLTLSQLVAELDLGGKRIAVERNGEVVPKSRHPDTPVADGDRFEIIVAVGGG